MLSSRMLLLIACLSIPALIGRLAGADDDRLHLHTFERQPLTGEYYSEGANVGDMNGDGHLDIVYGPYWFEGPAFDRRHEIYPARPQPRNAYADSFFSWIYDFDGDGASDVLSVGLPGSPAVVYQNPGIDEPDGKWLRHVLFDWVGNESPQWMDLTNDGRPELVCVRDGQVGYAAGDWKHPLKKWTFHPVSESPARPGAGRFVHGLGVGDIDGDGRLDLIVKDGWFQQPASSAESSPWTRHAVSFSPQGGADMFAYDVDGDGDNDVITSLAAHAFGLAWYEQVRNEGQISFRRHLIMGQSPADNRYGLVFSELHSLNLVDMDGDGLKDIVTGKTYYSHHQHAPQWDAGAVVYWFHLVRGAQGVDWVPYRADSDSGIGRQLVVADINRDKLPDIVVGGMKGASVLRHTARQVDRQTWLAAQPQVYRPGTDAVVKTKGPTANAPLPSKAQTPIGTKTGKSQAAPRAKPKATLPESRPAAKPSDAEGSLPVDAQGKPLNLDFETGTLQDWTAEGTAFAGQPVRGDTVIRRRPDMHSGHQGDYWIGGYEKGGDSPTGKLTSVPFTVTKPWATFWVGGGNHFETRVELVSQKTGTVLFKAIGRNNEALRRVVVDLNGQLGRQIFIRLIDEHRGGWGHINFDNFRLHERQPGTVSVPANPLRPDEYPHAGLSPEQGIRAMKLPDGFRVQLCAAEPEVQQPVAMAIDDRGRVWVAEAFEYPRRAPEGQGHDRILVFEDTNSDGKFDTRTVFFEGLNLVSGLEVGFGGVWVGAAPYLMFIPDRNGDDIPDGKPEVLLDGWGYHDTHETLNAFVWGPDGWLYGCHGVFTHSLVGKPGTPKEQRTPLNAAIWRYHPTRHEFDIFAHGTSNPWGVDFNDYGQAFCTACVIPHLYHVIQGARYQRQAGNHFNPHTYDDIKTIADHVHYSSASPHAGNNKSDEAGGGHAHAGAMIYLGGTWPAKYRNQIFMNNIHGQRINMDVLHAKGSGYVGSHGKDFLLTGDRASQIINLRYGPDGNAYVIDWYDMQACHSSDPSRTDRTNGRIYKVSYGATTVGSVDLRSQSDRELVELLLHNNDWYVRHARRILQEHAAAKPLPAEVRNRLAEIATTHADASRRLRAIWGLHVTGGLPENLVATLLQDESPYVRGWTIQLALEQQPRVPESLAARMQELAVHDSSPVVRLYLASAAQRIPLEQRWELLGALAAHSQDAGDHNLPLMYWYAAEPLAGADADAERALTWGMTAGNSIPKLRELMLRRIAGSGTDESLSLLVRGLGKADTVPVQMALLRGIGSALQGRRQMQPPAEWNEIYDRLSVFGGEEVRRETLALGVIFGNASAIRHFQEVAAGKSGSTAARQQAVETLLSIKDQSLVPILQKMIDDAALRELAIRGLAQYDDPGTPAVLLGCYTRLSPSEKRGVLATLCSRAPYAVELLRAVERKQVPGTDLSADLVRQMQNLKHDEISALLTKVWGTVRETAADKAKLIVGYKELLKRKGLPSADLSLGRAVFAKTCQNCHMLYGTGGKVGPDLTGSNRANIDYLLGNMVDPSAVMAKEYQPAVFALQDGRVVTGLVRSENAQSVTVQTADETLVLPKSEIEERVQGDKSMMPDDQLKLFSPHEIRSLVAYLTGRSQVPVLATSDNAGLLYNGQDLTGWQGDRKLWSVEQGEIVGRSPGISQNAFLVSDLVADDFRLTVEVKLVDNVGNSGIQFRSHAPSALEIAGYQADIGKDWWGKLYEEHGRGLLGKTSGEAHVKHGDWNRYEIRAEGHRIQTWINGQLCVDLEDSTGARRGIFALQLHAGGPTEVRFRNVKLEVLKPPVKE